MIQPTPYTSLPHTTLGSTLIGSSSGTVLDRPRVSRCRIMSRPTETSEHRFSPIYCYLIHVSYVLGKVKLQAESVVSCLTTHCETLCRPLLTSWPRLQRLTRPGPTVADAILRMVGGKSTMAHLLQSSINEGKTATERRASALWFPTQLLLYSLLLFHSINYSSTLFT
jgi:hypothetical protein